MEGYYKTIWTVGELPDKDVNRLMAQGWRLVNVSVLAIPDELYGTLRPNFFTTLVYDRDDVEGVSHE